MPRGGDAGESEGTGGKKTFASHWERRLPRMLSSRAPSARLCAMSPVLSKLESGPLPQKLLARYLLLLRLYPVLTKAVSSALLSALGSLLSQIIERSRKQRGPLKSFDLGEPLRFATYGFLFTGPLSHYFYLYLDQLFPPDVPFSTVKRLLLDRVVVAPAFLVLFFFVMNVLEGKDTSAFRKRVKAGYWPALKMNWKVWTPIQFVNVNYVPMQFRVLFGNLVALFWFAYLASVKK